MRRGQSTPATTLERATLLLEVLAAADGPLTLQAVARRAGLPRSTTHRLLAQLTEQRWVAHGREGYALGPAAYRLSLRGPYDDVRAVASSPLLDLSLRTGLVVHLGVLEGSVMHCLDKVGGTFARRVPSRVGARTPAHMSALGQAMIAWFEDDRVEQIVRHTPGDAVAPWRREAADLRRQLRRIRGRGGLNFARETHSYHLASCAAAVWDAEGVVAAVSVVGDSRLPFEEVAPMVHDTAQLISAELMRVRGTRRTRVAARRGTDADRLNLTALPHLADSTEVWL